MAQSQIPFNKATRPTADTNEN